MNSTRDTRNLGPASLIIPPAPLPPIFLREKDFGVTNFSRGDCGRKNVYARGRGGRERERKQTNGLTKETKPTLSWVSTRTNERSSEGGGRHGGEREREGELTTSQARQDGTRGGEKNNNYWANPPPGPMGS